MKRQLTIEVNVRKSMMSELVILDFETTGSSPNYSRIIEVGAIIISDTNIVDKLSQLMYPGRSIPYFITNFTGITNQMVKGKPSPEEFMPTLKNFIGARPILAHNASFDQKFLIAEMENSGNSIDNKFLCTLKLARRLILDAPNYKLTTLTSHLKIETSKDHKPHRALSDVMATLGVWLYIKKYVASYIKTNPDLNFFEKLMQHPRKNILNLLDKYIAV
ncbi:MAG TPA: 3'-5' exonuclease [Gammaproteobacteria bacterium]|nr:3'-5' exonuclease [Gammaproteobacteria bacterium]